MNTMDLDAIARKHIEAKPYYNKYMIAKLCMREAVHEALVLASENAAISKAQKMPNGTWEIGVKRINKQSILDIEKLIK